MDVTTRILAEYADWPTLRLTLRQAARLWALEPVHCQRLLKRLVNDGHLFIDERGQYAWTGHVQLPVVRASRPGASEAAV